MEMRDDVSNASDVLRDVGGGTVLKYNISKDDNDSNDSRAELVEDQGDERRGNV